MRKKIPVKRRRKPKPGKEEQEFYSLHLKTKSIPMGALIELTELTGKMKRLTYAIKKSTDPYKKEDLERRYYGCIMERAELLIKQKEFRSAAALYKKLPRKAYGEQHSHGLAKILIEEGRYDEARTILEKALKKYPESSALLNAMGIFFQRTGDFNEALRYFDRIDETTDEGSRTLLCNKAITFNWLGYFEEAHKLFASLLESEHDNLEYLEEMGYCNLMRGEKWEALRCFQEARDFGDESVSVYNGLCSACIATGLYHQAYSIALEGLEKLPGEVRLYANLAEAAMALGNIEEAGEIFQKGFALDSECKPLKNLHEKLLRDKEAEQEAEENEKNNIYTVARTQEGADLFCRTLRIHKSRDPFLKP